MVAAAGGFVLLVSLFLPWFGISGNEDLCGSADCNAFQVPSLIGSGVVGFLLVLGALAPWILVWIVVRGHELSWPPGEVTMIAGLIAVVLILYLGIVDQPGRNQNFVSLDIGWYLGLVGAFGIVVGGAISQMRRGGVARKPPGSF
jgi:hypothetical protein